MDGTGVRALLPSVINIGQIRSSVVSTLSRTMRRAQSARRLRRGAGVGAGPGAGRACGSTSVKRTRDSIGRPYLKAMAKAPEWSLLFIALAGAPLAVAGRRLGPAACARRAVQAEVLFDRGEPLV